MAKGGLPMSTATIAIGEEIMTDYQFRSIIKMILAIARKTKDADAIIHELENLLPSDERAGQDEGNSRE
jgi:hypothetical protein